MSESTNEGPAAKADLESLKPLEGANRKLRRRMTLKGELVLVSFPTLTILLVLGLMETLTDQRLLFASLASSAFLIYLDPQHGTNSVRTLVISQMSAAVIGLTMYLIVGAGYASGATAMVLTIVVMITLDALHPPAVATSLIFAFRAEEASSLLLFGLAVGMTALLVVLERVALRVLARYGR